MEPALHGRDAPLTALRRALEGALAGRGQLALVSGEAGIGKSALAAAIAREAEARGAAVTWGRAWEFADAPPYFPVWPCLRALGIGIGEGQQHRAQHDEGQAFHLWENVVASLARASANAPFVWLLEDLHAADLGTLDLLTFLAQPLRAMRGLVVATVRAADPRLTDRVMQRLTRMARDGLDVRLEPLVDVDVAALAEETLGRAVPASALRRFIALTGGNPLFVIECARAFRSSGGIESALGSLPPTVRQVVLDRVIPLPETTRHALACGAVLGREFSAALVARMDESLPARVIDSLLPALRSGLIKETKPGDFIFGHALVRDAIDDTLGVEERGALHGRAENALAALGDTSDVLVERARHALLAPRAGDGAYALAIADRATELLEREGAFDRAFDLHARIGEARHAGLLPPLSAEKKLHVAHIARTAGRSDDSRRLAEEVLASARTSGDAVLFARAALLHSADVRPAVVDRLQVLLLEEARAALGENSPEVGCRVLARLATALQPAADPSVPFSMAKEALRLAKDTGDNPTILDVLELASWGVYFAPLSERIEWSNELLERALEANDVPKALAAYSRLAFHHMEAGDFEAFGRDTASMLALSDEIGHPSHRWRPLLLASAQALARGHFAESDRYVTEVTELAALIDDPAIALTLVNHDIMRKRLQRRDGELRAVLAKLETVMTGTAQPVLVSAAIRATCAARMEDSETTRAELAIFGSRANAVQWGVPFAAFLAEAYAMAGADDDRRRVRELLGGASTRELPGDPAFTYEGPVVRLLGLLDAALGDLKRAETELREAHALAVERKHAPWVAQTAYEIAKVLRRAGREEEARGWIEQCSAIAQELGMTGLLGSADAEARASAGVVKMEQEGEVFRIERAGVTVRVKDSRGVQLLARLVERPGEEVHVLALASDDATGIAETTAGEMLDERARKAYHARLADIEEGIARAERDGDAKQAAKLAHEMDLLGRELARAAGLGGRARQAASATERARVNVQRRVRDAIARITEVDENLGRFFSSAVSTGTFCCFRP